MVFASAKLEKNPDWAELHYVFSLPVSTILYVIQIASTWERNVVPSQCQAGLHTMQWWSVPFKIREDDY